MSTIEAVEAPGNFFDADLATSISKMRYNIKEGTNLISHFLIANAKGSFLNISRLVMNITAIKGIL